MPRISKKARLILLSILTALCIQSCTSDNGPAPPAVDTTPPSQPASLSSSNITETSVDLSWQAATDNVGVTGYSIYQNGVNTTSTSSTSSTMSGLSENINYSFSVKARDAAGNESSFSNQISITTIAAITTVQVKNGNLETYLGNIIDNSPGSSEDNYTVPTTTQLNMWDAVLGNILQEKLDEAALTTAGFGYQITEFTDTSLSPNQVFFILEKQATKSNYWGTYVFSKTPTRNQLILMAPHSKYDTNTGKQAVHSFTKNLAKALLINGTHRCNSNTASSCSGTTSACGSSEAFRISDMAHTTTSAFQKSTEHLFSAITNSVFVQLHGFARQATDPYVILSNGTRETPTTDYAALLRDALTIEDNTLTFKIAHLDASWTRLIGFTNTQGRLINNSSNFCNASATNTSGRFIHVEQEKTKLRDNVVGWTKMSNAIGSVF